MSAITPTPQQVQRLAEKGPEGSLVMVNLLKYRAKAAYSPDRAEAKENLSGRQAYQRYGLVAFQHVTKRGGKVVWGGPQKTVVVGDDKDNDWDEIVCVNYPSRAAFLDMLRDPDYAAGHYHREAGLERTALICCGAGTAA